MVAKRGKVIRAHPDFVKRIDEIQRTFDTTYDGKGVVSIKDITKVFAKEPIYFVILEKKKSRKKARIEPFSPFWLK